MNQDSETQNSAPQTAWQLAMAIGAGALSSEDVVSACLEQIEAHEDTIGAWAFLDQDLALAQAREADQFRHRGMDLGALHGIPVGIKDIIDTADMPTEYGTVLHSGHTPAIDASLVSQLRAAGAIIMGKTVTAELAVSFPGKTRNPHNPEHSPGGSSSGSAAAVAAGMVPLAVGTQTNGSVIRPASFCGVYGFKPSHGLISRYRVLSQSRFLDTVGVFARSLEDLALIAEAIMAYDSRDPDMRARPRPQISKVLAEEPPMEPHLAFIRTPVWDDAEETTKDALRELIEHVGENVDVVRLPEMFDDAHQVHSTIMHADIAKSYAKLYRDGKDKLSDVLCERIEVGQKILAVDYNSALDRVVEFHEALDEIHVEYDAILTPSAAGEAPASLETTGNPGFCTIWTLCGTPAINLPVLQGPKGLPIGAQIVSQKGDDARLFRTARWLLKKLEA